MITEVSPEQPVGGTAPVGNIVEKHVQLLVIVEVSSDDCANGRGISKSSSSNVLHERTLSALAMSNTLYHRTFNCHPAFLHCPVLLPHPECRVAALQEKSVGAVPVAVHNICLPIAIEVSQCYASAVLVPVLHTFTSSHKVESFSAG